MTQIFLVFGRMTAIVRWLLVSQFAFNVGSFLVVPFIAVYLNHRLGYDLAFVGVQLTLKLVSQRGLTLVGGVLSDRVGAQKIMVAGTVIRAGSFLLFLLGVHPILVSFASITFGFGGALFVPASKAAISMLSDAEHKQLMFSMRSTSSNLGMAVGGMIGSVLVNFEPGAIFVCAAVIQLACGAILFHPNLIELQRGHVLNRGITRPGTDSLLASVVRIYRIPGIPMLATLYAIYIALYSQFEFTIPLEASSRFGVYAVGIVYVVNTLMVFGCQVPLNIYLGQRMEGRRIIVTGFVCMALSLVGFLIPTPVAGFLVLVALFSIGEILIDPSIDALSSSQVQSEELGTLFGLLGVIALLGGGIGNFLGAYFFHATSSGNLWLLCAGLALVAAVTTEAFLYIHPIVPIKGKCTEH